MKQLKTLLLAAALICAGLISASCSRTVVSKRGKRVGHGPPPHAPAHGHRRKHHHHGGVELVYDSGRGVYVVVGFPDHYYFEGHYYRFHQDQWHMSVDINSGWKPASNDRLPSGLRAKGKAKHAKNHPGRGHGAKKNKKW
ncbi:MAG: hypothetical protein ACYTEL_23240 [Planctomycetota bacterium]